MAAIILLAAAYAAYSHAEEKKNAIQNAELDPEITLAGKEKISLIPREKESSILELPFCTLSFFDGSYKDAEDHLRGRIRDIITKNPWLAGWMIIDKDDNFNVKILYDPTGSDRCLGTVEVFEPGAIPLNREGTTYKEYPEILKPALVGKNQDLMGKNKPLFKVSIIPDLEQPSERFALAVSMSRVLGDHYTYYKIFSMFDKDAEVKALNPVRKTDHTQALEIQMGSREANYLNDAISQPLFTNPFENKEKDPVVIKFFYIDENWVIARKGRRQSVFDKESSLATVVSASAIITSWFFNINEASVGLFIGSTRNRLDHCDIGDNDAGNYFSSIAFTPIDYKTPGLIQTSFSTLRRCGTDPPSELPRLGGSMTSSLSTNWAQYYRDEIYLHDNISEQLHLPLIDVSILDILPNKVSHISLFTARPSGIDGSERRAGAFVICKESVWRKIEESGIVDEMIVE